MVLLFKSTGVPATNSTGPLAYLSLMLCWGKQLLPVLNLSKYPRTNKNMYARLWIRASINFVALCGSDTFWAGANWVLRFNTQRCQKQEVISARTWNSKSENMRKYEVKLQKTCKHWILWISVNNLYPLLRLTVSSFGFRGWRRALWRPSICLLEWGICKTCRRQKQNISLPM